MFSLTAITSPNIRLPLSSSLRPVPDIT
jgi:hypothetical protein